MSHQAAASAVDPSTFRDLVSAIDVSWISDRLVEALQISSENPFHEDPRPGFRELEMATWLADHMSELGLDVEMAEVLPGRPNVFGRLSRVGDTSALMLAGHTDTARTVGYAEAYDITIRDGRVYGRGACDMKAALVAYLAVARVLRDSGVRLERGLIVAGVMDEEFQMLGAKAIGRDGPWAKQGIVGEPTSLEVCPSAKGRVSTKFITRGRAAHSSVPETGINAIEKMGKVLALFETYNDELKGRQPHSLCGHARFMPGVIRGGVQVNMVPEYCELEVDRRTLPGETPDLVLEELRARLDGSDGRGGALAEVTEPTWVVAPNDVDPGEPVVVALRRAHQAVLGRDPGIHAFKAGTDAPYLGFPAVVCGPGSIRQAHSAPEFVELDEVVAAARIYLHATLALAGLAS